MRTLILFFMLNIPLCLAMDLLDIHGAPEKSNVILHNAIERKNTDQVKNELAKEDVDYEALDHEGRTPLHHALFLAREKICELLLKAGANPNARIEEGVLCGFSMLDYAVHFKMKNMVVYLLKYGALVNTKSPHYKYKGWTPLHFAVCTGRSDVVKVLIAAGADATLPQLISMIDIPSSLSFSGLRKMVCALHGAGLRLLNHEIVHAYYPHNPFVHIIFNASSDAHSSCITCINPEDLSVTFYDFEKLLREAFMLAVMHDRNDLICEIGQSIMDHSQSRNTMYNLIKECFSCVAVSGNIETCGVLESIVTKYQLSLKNDDYDQFLAKAILNNNAQTALYFLRRGSRRNEIRKLFRHACLQNFMQVMPALLSAGVLLQEVSEDFGARERQCQKSIWWLDSACYAAHYSEVPYAPVRHETSTVLSTSHGYCLSSEQLMSQRAVLINARFKAYMINQVFSVLSQERDNYLSYISFLSLDILASVVGPLVLACALAEKA